MGVLQILANPNFAKAGTAIKSIEAVRLDYDQATDEVVLSMVVGNGVKHFRAPCKCTCTPAEVIPHAIALIDSLLEDLAGGPVCQAVAEIPPSEPPAPTT